VTGQGGVGQIQKLVQWNAGNVIQGQTATNNYTVTNGGHGKTAPLQITGPTPTGSIFTLSNDLCSGVSLQPTGSPGSTCTFTVGFAPTTNNSTPGTAQAVNLMVIDSQSDTIGTRLAGMPISATWFWVMTPNPYNLGTVAEGQSATMSFTVTNYGAQTSLLFDGVRYSITPTSLLQYFSLGSNNTCLAALAPLASCTLAVTYTAPKNALSLSATVDAVDQKRVNAASAAFTVNTP
jgi:hypothetical protein